MNKVRFNTNNFLELHLLVSDEVRPIILIAPGGAYVYTSDREALPIAKMVNNAGFHAGIIYYREDLLKYPETIDEFYLFVKYLRENSNKLNISDVHILGFSAGGHYAASYAVAAKNYGDLGKVDKQILLYPALLGSAQYGHELCIKTLMGDTSDESRGYYSLETQVTKETPAAFIVHTYEDAAVPVENSIIYAEALRKNNVPVEMHLYQSGHHGLSLATREVAGDNDPDEYEETFKHFSTWANLAMSWLKYNK